MTGTPSKGHEDAGLSLTETTHKSKILLGHSAEAVHSRSLDGAYWTIPTWRKDRTLLITPIRDTRKLPAQSRRADSFWPELARTITKGFGRATPCGTT